MRDYDDFDLRHFRTRHAADFSRVAAFYKEELEAHMMIL